MSDLTFVILDEAQALADVLPDLPERCEHSDHTNPGWRHHHQGPATHWIVAIHNCETDHPTAYPACALFVKYVQSMMFEPWMCPVCGHTDQGRRMVKVVAPIKP